jgi:hypothetical protein
MNKLTNKHDNHEVFIKPVLAKNNVIHMGLYCKECIYTKGKRKGKHHYITFIPHRQLDELLSIGVEIINGE